MKKIVFLLSVILGVFAVNSCSEPYDEALELEEFMYLSITGAAENPAVKEVLPDETAVYKISVFFAGTTNYERGQIQAEIVPDETLIDAFNAENNTVYQPLPAGTWSVDKSSVVIENGKNVSDPVTLTVRGLQIDFKSEYLLPLTIKSVNGGSVPLNEELKTAYYVIKKGVYNWQKSTWEVISFKSEWNNSTYAIKNCFDDNKATTWHSEPFDASKNGLPQWMVVDMKKVRPAIQGFKIWNRQEDHGQEPKHVVFSVSDDNVNWTTILDLPEMSQVWREELNYATTTLKTGRYLKVDVQTNWGGAAWTYLGEITPY